MREAGDRSARVLLDGRHLRRARARCRSKRPSRPTRSIPTAIPKLAFERALRWYDEAYGLRSVRLRYFNAAGATERPGRGPRSGDAPDSAGAAGRRRQAAARSTIFGDDYPTPDGTCIRDYIHVDRPRARARARDRAACDAAQPRLQPRLRRRRHDGARGDRRGPRRDGARDPGAHRCAASRRSGATRRQLRAHRARTRLAARAADIAASSSPRGDSRKAGASSRRSLAGAMMRGAGCSRRSSLSVRDDRLFAEPGRNSPRPRSAARRSTSRCASRATTRSRPSTALGPPIAGASRELLEARVAARRRIRPATSRSASRRRCRRSRTSPTKHRRPRGLSRGVLPRESDRAGAIS